MRKFFISLLVGLALAGCLTIGSELRNVRSQISQVNPSQGRVWVYRDVGIGPMGLMSPALYIDGQRAGNVGPFSTRYFDLAPGSHTVALKWKNLDGKWLDGSLATTVAAGKESTILIDSSGNTFLIGEVDGAVFEESVANGLVFDPYVPPRPAGEQEPSGGGSSWWPF